MISPTCWILLHPSYQAKSAGSLNNFQKQTGTHILQNLHFLSNGGLLIHTVLVDIVLTMAIRVIITICITFKGFKHQFEFAYRNRAGKVHNWEKNLWALYRKCPIHVKTLSEMSLEILGGPLASPKENGRPFGKFTKILRDPLDYTVLGTRWETPKLCQGPLRLFPSWPLNVFIGWAKMINPREKSSQPIENKDGR